LEKEELATSQQKKDKRYVLEVLDSDCLLVAQPPLNYESP
jgi:hypothetical protein